MASCEHACDLVRMLGESGWKARPRAGGAQVLHRVLPVGFGAVCGLPVARSESAFARHAPAQPCVQRRCAAYGERCSDGGGVAARQELVQDGTDGVGGLAGASASLVAQSTRRPVMMCLCSPGSRCVSPGHRMPPANSGHGEYRQRSAEGA